MIRALVRSVCTLALAAATAPAAVHAQQTFVIPPSFEDICATGAASAQPFPFATATNFNDPYRYQQVYESSAFPELAIGEWFRISEVRFRIDEFSGDLSPFDYSDITVNASTTLLGVGELVTGSAVALDSNRGSDQTTVFSGGFTWDACGTPDTCVTRVCGPDFTPAPFDQAIQFTTAFDYDPALGNLLLEVFNLDLTPVTQVFDAAEVPSPVTVRVRETSDPLDPDCDLDREDPNCQHFWPTNFPNLGLVTEFVYTVVPEPGSSLLAPIALVALAGLRRARS